MNSLLFFLPFSSSSLSLTHPASGNFLVLCFLERGWDNMEPRISDYETREWNIQTVWGQSKWKKDAMTRKGCMSRCLPLGSATLSCLHLSSFLTSLYSGHTDSPCTNFHSTSVRFMGSAERLPVAMAVGTCGLFIDNSLPACVFFSISKVLDAE